jgi:serine protease Do
MTMRLDRLFPLALLVMAAAFTTALSPVALAQRVPQSLPEEPVVPRPGAPTGFEELAQELMPSVVNIITANTVLEDGLPDVPPGSPLEDFNEFFGRDGDGFRREGALGSGFVISPDGYVVTNDHVIKDADEIELVFSDESRRPARLVGSDPDTDIALLKVEGDEPFQYVEFGDSNEADVGSWVIAIGNPFGLGGSVSAGIVSARSRDIGGAFDDFIQTDAAINQGNSGGPLFNMRGEVIGVNTAIYSRTGGSVGIGFSVPSNLANYIVGELQTHGKVRRARLGVNIQAIDPTLAEASGLGRRDGVMVTNVDDDSPAEAAGLRVGDIILEFGSTKVGGSGELTRTVAASEIGEPIEVEILRKKKRTTLEVVLEERETETEEDDSEEQALAMADASNALGVDLVIINDDLRRRYNIPRDVEGVVVDRVAPRGPAAGKLRRGDVVLELDQETILDVEAARESIAAAQRDGRPLLVHIQRQGRDVFYGIDLASGS